MMSIIILPATDTSHLSAVSLCFSIYNKLLYKQFEQNCAEILDVTLLHTNPDSSLM